MRGYIRRRGTQSWQISVELPADPVTGSRRRTFRSVKGTKRDAERELTALSRSVDTGVYVEPGRDTVASFLRRWLRDYAQSNVAPRTYQPYEGIVQKHLVPALGGIRLADLRPAHIITAEREWLESGRTRGNGGLSPRSVLHHHRVLHAALTQAVRWHDLAVNPAAAVSTPRVPRTDMRVLDAEQAARLIEAAAGSEFEVPIKMALYTGLRMGELLGLRWSDVDLDAGRLSIQQAAYQLRGGGVGFGSTKTHRSRRPVTLPADAVAALRSHRLAQTQRRLVAGPAWREELETSFSTTASAAPCRRIDFARASSASCARRSYPQSGSTTCATRWPPSCSRRGNTEGGQ